MAVTVIDTRIVFSGATSGNGQADSATDWTGGDTTPGTDTSTFAEATGSLTSAINIGTGTFGLVLASSLDLSDSMIYIQSLNAAVQGGWDAGGANNTHHGIFLSDGTNQAVFHMAGNDKDVFKHADNQVSFQCLLLDGAEASNWNTAGHVTMLAGTFGSLNMAAITIVGTYYETLSKGLGGGFTCAIDIIRYGNSGLTIVGGATGGGNGSTFLQIATEDRSTADLKALGVIREYSTGIYGLQGSLTFGNTITGDSWFLDDGVVIVFEDRPVADDKYFFNVVGSATGGEESHFVLTNSTITTAGPLVTCDFSDAGIDTLTITGCTLSGLGNAISFGNDTDAASHTVTNNTFASCGQIDPGDTIFTNNVISASTGAVNSGAMLIDADGTSVISDLSFIFDTAGHAIYITATGTYTLTNFSYSGYNTSSPGSNPTPSTGSTDAMIYNNSGGTVTLNITGGDTPTVRNGAGADTIVVSNITVTITVQDSGAVVIPGAQVAIFLSSDDSVLLASTTTDENGQVSASVSASIGAIYVRARQSTKIATFNTDTGVVSGTDIITTDAAHSFAATHGEPVVYDKNGGTAVVGLTAGDTYYVHHLSTTTLTLHNSAADAISNTSIRNLTLDAAAETHNLDPVRYFSNSTVGTVGSDNLGITVTMVTDTTVTG